MKILEIWDAIDDRRDKAINKREWRRSFEAVRLAMQYINLNLITVKQDFDNLHVPVTKDGARKFMQRKVRVSRNGQISAPTNIESLLNGNSSLLTQEEHQKMNMKRHESRIVNAVKGSCDDNVSEKTSIDKLDALLSTSEHLERAHLLECRSADIAYSLHGSDIWFPDQVKCARVAPHGECIFRGSKGPLRVKDMLKILSDGMSLTCIGLSRDAKPEVVWFLHGQVSIQILENFDVMQCFHPLLKYKIKSSNNFTLAMTDSQIKFNVGISLLDRQRLLTRKIQTVQQHARYSLSFLNDDASQIPSIFHQVELKSFQMVQAACRLYNVTVERLVKDSYTVIDFRVCGARVQDKCGDLTIGMRKPGRYPYDPDGIDMFQISSITTRSVYALPMRINNGKEICSFFSEKQLMKNTISLSKKWRSKHDQYRYNLSSPQDVAKYLEMCRRISKTPKMTDTGFYARMLKNNVDSFGSLRQIREKTKLTQSRPSFEQS